MYVFPLQFCGDRVSSNDAFIAADEEKEKNVNNEMKIVQIDHQGPTLVHKLI